MHYSNKGNGEECVHHPSTNYLNSWERLNTLFWFKLTEKGRDICVTRNVDDNTVGVAWEWSA